MSNPIGYYFYLRAQNPRRFPAARPTSTSSFGTRPGHDRQQTYGLLLLAAVVCCPIIATCALAYALQLLA
jgi:hypothetical protein